MGNQNEASQRGFSFVEVIAALLIISLLGVSLLSILFNSTFASTASNERITSLHLAKLVLRKYQSMSFDDVKKELGLKSVDPKKFIPVNTPVEYDPGKYEVKVLITQHATLPDKLLLITVTVSWNGQKTELNGLIKKDI